MLKKHSDSEIEVGYHSKEPVLQIEKRGYTSQTVADYPNKIAINRRLSHEVARKRVESHHPYDSYNKR